MYLVGSGCGRVEKMVILPLEMTWVRIETSATVKQHLFTLNCIHKRQKLRKSRPVMAHLKKHKREHEDPRPSLLILNKLMRKYTEIFKNYFEIVKSQCKHLPTYLAR